MVQPTIPDPVGGELEWGKSLGMLEASRTAAETIPVSQPTGTFTLPQVLSVEDALERDGVWVLLDRRGGKVHFFHPDRGLLRTMGRRGPGPGELDDPMAMALRDTTLWILNQRGMVLDRFSLASGFQARRRTQGGGCLVGLAKRLVATATGDLIQLRVCPATLPGPGTAWIEEVSSEGLLSPMVSMPLGEPGSRRIHFVRQPEIVGGSASLFLGTWDTPCFMELGQGGQTRGSRCLPDHSRPPTPEGERSKLESRFRGITGLGLLPMEVPDYLPWYDRIFFTSQGLVVRRVRGLEERDLVLLPPVGSPSITDRVFPEVTFVGETTLLAVRDLFQGTQLTVYPNPWG
jgi:hypothetical protein